MIIPRIQIPARPRVPFFVKPQGPDDQISTNHERFAEVLAIFGQTKYVTREFQSERSRSGTMASAAVQSFSISSSTRYDFNIVEYWKHPRAPSPNYKRGSVRQAKQRCLLSSGSSMGCKEKTGSEFGEIRREQQNRTEPAQSNG